MGTFIVNNTVFIERANSLIVKVHNLYQPYIYSRSCSFDENASHYATLY